MTKIELDAAGIEAAAEAMWRHEVSGMPAASRARSTQLWEGQASALRERWIGRATAAITAYLSASKAVPEVPVAWPGRKFCEIAENNARELARFIKGDDDKAVILDAALAIKTLLAALFASPPKTYEDGLREAAAAGWNACRKSIYAVCEDVMREADRIRIKGPVGSHSEEQHSKGYHAGSCHAAKSIARGFNAMEAGDDDNFTAAIEALIGAPK